MAKARHKSRIENLKNLVFSPVGIQYIKYNLVGGIGVGLNLIITFLLTEFFFGRQGYLYAFIIGTIGNLIYNYVTYVKYIFPTQGITQQKKLFFFVYSLATVFVQIALADILVSLLGVDWYMPVLMSTIGIISVANYLLFKIYVFNNDRKFGLEKLKPRHYIAIILGGFTLTAIYLISLGGALFWDSSVYIAMGKYIFSGGAFGIYEIFRPLLLPLILGLFWRIGISPILAGQAIVLFSALGCLYLTYQIGKKIIGDWYGTLALALLAISPTFLFYSSKILTDIPALFLILLSGYIFLEKRSLILAGFIAGLAVLMRFPSGIVLIALSLGIFLETRKDKSIGEIIHKNLQLYTGFILAILPYLLYNYGTYGNPLIPFFEGSAIIAQVGDFISEGILFYPINLFIESASIVFAFIGAHYLSKDGTKQNSFLWSALFLSFLLFGYLSLLARKEMRYLILILPFLYLIGSYGIKKLNLGDKTRKIIVAAFLSVAVLQSAYIISLYQTGLNLPIDDDIYQNYLLAGSDGLLVTSSPAIMAYQDIPGIVVYSVQNNMFVYYERHGPYEYRINSCELFCRVGDKKCETDKSVFISRIKLDYNLTFHKSIGGCDYYVFDKRIS